MQSPSSYGFSLPLNAKSNSAMTPTMPNEIRRPMSIVSPADGIPDGSFAIGLSTNNGIGYIDECNVLDIPSAVHISSCRERGMRKSVENRFIVTIPSS